MFRRPLKRSKTPGGPLLCGLEGVEWGSSGGGGYWDKGKIEGGVGGGGGGGGT